MKRAIALVGLLALSIGLVGCGSTTSTPAEKYTLTVGVQGQGTVTPASGLRYDAGTVVTLAPTPATGWVFGNWTGADGSSVAANKIVMNSNKNVVAVFVEAGPDTPSHTLTIHIVGNGTANPTSGSSFPEGTLVALEPSPGMGWAFVGWDGPDAYSVDNGHILMDADKTITAVFAELEADIRVSGCTRGIAVKFDGTGSTGPVQSYTWNIDGNTKTGAVVYNTFTSTGSKYVSLTVTYPGGTTKTTTYSSLAIYDPATLSGTVTDGWGPVGGAYVEVSNDSGTLALHTYSSSDGHFTITGNLPVREYLTLYAYKSGYPAFQASKSVSLVSGPNTVTFSGNWY